MTNLPVCTSNNISSCSSGSIHN